MEQQTDLKTGFTKAEDEQGGRVSITTNEAVEYRDFTEYNLKRTIGIKTIRFNRGYVKNAPQMQWTVEKVVLLDGEGGECDPFDVPEDFCPTAIAIHLGKRIG